MPMSSCRASILTLSTTGERITAFVALGKEASRDTIKERGEDFEGHSELVLENFPRNQLHLF
jgi:hypothetical protein